MFLDLLRNETAASPDRRRAALAGLRAYQQASRPPQLDPKPVIASAGRALLRDYSGSGRPVIFVPSLINPPHVLDLAPDNSLLRWLAGRGLRPLLVDWGTPSPDERTMSVAGHVETLLLPLIDAVGEPASLAGYCLGGTMALAAATRRRVPSLALIAAPWNFAGFPREARRDLGELWAHVEASAEHLGMLPMEALQASFWRLDPGRTITKFEEFGRLPVDGPAARAFVMLEDWANDGPPLTYAAAHELLIDFFGDDTPGRGLWSVCGQPADPSATGCPVLNIISTADRIVPAASAAAVGETLSLALGHVGMVVGSRAREALWEPLARWLSQPRNN